MNEAEVKHYKTKEKAYRRTVPPCELTLAGILPATAPEKEKQDETAAVSPAPLQWYLLEPGLAVVRGALDHETQRRLMTQALVEFPFDHVSNLSKDYWLSRNVWEMHVAESNDPISQRPQHEREAFLKHAPPSKLQELESTFKQACKGGGETCDGALASRLCDKGEHTDSDEHADQHTHEEGGFAATKTVAGRTLLPKLRSLNIGYRFNWFTRTYDEDDFQPPPSELSQLFKRLCRQTRVIHGYEAEMRPEAVVVNYYKHNDRMMGHVDDSEECNTPLLSLSLGAGCLFMCGREGRVAHLRTGDMVVMYGQGREARHSVPRILPLDDDDEVRAVVAGLDPCVAAYVRKTGLRININARQVKH